MRGRALPRFEPGCPEEAIARFVDGERRRGRKSPCGSRVLAGLLPERLPLYQGRGTNQIARIRGYILAAFEDTGLPRAGLPFVLEALESERNAYLVAAAARAVRGMRNPQPSIVRYLLRAVHNIHLIDDTVTFERFKPPWPFQQPTTALGEIEKTLRWLAGGGGRRFSGLRASLADTRGRDGLVALANGSGPELTGPCCRAPGAGATERRALPLPPRLPRRLASAWLEDQDGERLQFADFFTGGVSAVAFFYTRCRNPNKCPLTVSKLARLRAAADALGLPAPVRIAGITYDPGYDDPDRLRSYGRSRGLRFDAGTRLFRCGAGTLGEIAEYFGLGVSYSGTVVNQHRVELYVLDRRGSIRHTLARVQWSEHDVAAMAAGLAMESKWRAATAAAWRGAKFACASAVPLAVLLAPKCPVCWSVYLGSLGALGVQLAPLTPWVKPLLYTLIGLNLALIFRRGRSETGPGAAFGLTAAGLVLMLVGELLANPLLAQPAGAALVMAGAVADRLTARSHLRFGTRSRQGHGPALPFGGTGEFG